MAAKMKLEGFHGRIPAKPHDLIDGQTPLDKCIVLCHLGIPEISAGDWRLAIEGLVKHPRSLSLAELQALPKVEISSVHQCAGSPLAPHQPTQRVCNVRWGGARLADVLHLCAVLPAARFVWSTGADAGSFGGIDCGNYAKDLPLDRVTSNMLLAYEMNGAPLREEHGFPVRLAVPGFYGTNSVKWLKSLTLAGERAPGPFTTRWYNEPDEGGAGSVPVWDLAPQSVIVSPRPGGSFVLGRPVRIWGWAWSGDELRSLEISTDCGANWEKALLERRVDQAWQRFSCEWTPARPGPHVLMSRAISPDGRTQPFAHRRNAIYPVTVQITG